MSEGRNKDSSKTDKKRKRDKGGKVDKKKKQDLDGYKRRKMMKKDKADKKSKKLDTPKKEKKPLKEEKIEEVESVSIEEEVETTFEPGVPYKKVDIPDGVVKSFREENQITIESDVEYPPILSFDQLQFPKELLHGIKGFEKPTPIQSQCWPIAFDKRDIIGIAETGSGKTLAFSLPILYQIAGKTLPKAPVVLILSPTRELATQTAEVIKSATEKAELRVCILRHM